MKGFSADMDCARKLDAQDPLAGYRARFHIPKTKEGRECIYLCGNSLGLQPATAEAAVLQELADWKAMGVSGYFNARNPWVSYVDALAAPMAEVVGAKPSEVAVMNSLTLNLHLMMVSFYRPTQKRHKIVIEKSAFPSDQYAAAAQIRLHGFDPATSLIEADGDVEKLLEEQGESITLLLLGGVNYYTGRLFDIKGITSLARAKGIVAGFDLAHAAGNVPLSLHDWGVDFACWCNYKYLNAGPGSVAACFVHERHAQSFDLPRLSGWWGQDVATRFKMAPDFHPAEGAAGWQVSNSPVFSLAAVRASLELFSQAGMGALREKSILLTGYLEFLLDGLKSDAFGIMKSDVFDIITPCDPAQRGCQLSIVMKKDGRKVFEALSAAGVVCDWREPGCIRVAPVPFYTSFMDIHEFTRIFGATIKTATHQMCKK